MNADAADKLELSALEHRLYTSGACSLGVAAVAASFSGIELWSNLYHDPFRPTFQEHAWTILRFNTYGALFIAAIACLACWMVLAAMRLQTAAPKRRSLLVAALCGAAFYMLLHHSRHILWYWEAGGTW